MMNKDNRNDKIRKIAKKGLTFSLCAVLAGGLAAGSFEGVNKLAGWSGATTVEAASNKDETTLTYAKSEKKDADASDSKSDTGKDTGSTAKGSLDVSEIVSEALPSIVSITTKSVQEVQNYFGMYGMYGYAPQQQEQEVEGSGSGIIVGKNDDELLIATNYHVVDAANSINEFAKDTNTPVKNIKRVIQVVIASNDVSVDAELEQSSEANDIAILKLKKNIYNSKCFSLSSKANLQETQTVYALGYPYEQTTYGQDFSKLKNEDVTIEKGAVSKFTTKGGTNVIVNSAQISRGNSGGPLVDSQGNVVGVNSYTLGTSDGGNYYYAIEIDTVREMLDALGIQYTSADGSTQGANVQEGTDATQEAGEEETTEAQPEADKSALDSAISDAGDVDQSKYTEDSFKVFEEELESAKTVSGDAAATQNQVDAATNTLKSAQEGLKEKSNKMIFIAIGGVAFVIIIVVLIIVMSSKKKKKANSSSNQSMNNGPVNGGGFTPPSGGGFNTTGGGFKDSGNGNMQYNSPSQDYYGEGAGETSVLNEGAGETTLLSGQSMAQATLYRESNCENIRINKGVFTLGKERKKVDYCISDNSSVSRTHAEVVAKNGTFYLIDQKSTNGTYLNDVRLNPLQEMELKNGDKIRISDETFVFKLM